MPSGEILAAERKQDRPVLTGPNWVEKSPRRCITGSAPDRTAGRRPPECGYRASSGGSALGPSG